MHTGKISNQSSLLHDGTRHAIFRTWDIDAKICTIHVAEAPPTFKLENQNKIYGISLLSLIVCATTTSDRKFGNQNISRRIYC